MGGMTLERQALSHLGLALIDKRRKCFIVVSMIIDSSRHVSDDIVRKVKIQQMV